MSRDEATLLDIARAGQLARTFIQGVDRAGFLGDLKTQSAVIHQLLILGEAVKRLSQEYCEAHPQIPWSLIAGMRDKLIHHYDIVDLDQVWTTVQNDVPALLAVVQPLPPTSN